MTYPLAHEIRVSVAKRLGYSSNLYQVEGEVNAFRYCSTIAGQRGCWTSQSGRLIWTPNRVIQARIVGRRGTSVAYLEETNTPSAGLPLIVRRSP